MKKNSFLFIFVFAGLACSSGKKQTAAKGPLDSDRILIVTVNQFWGGMPTCELERKDGKDKLIASYILKSGTKDSLVSTQVTISKTDADSIFSAADKLNFNPDNIYGNGDDKTGMKAILSLKKRAVPQSVTYQRLQTINDLPADAKNVIVLVNKFAPEGFKLY